MNCILLIHFPSMVYGNMTQKEVENCERTANRMRNNGDICNIKQCTFELLHSLPYYGYCNILSSFIGLLSFYDSPKFVAFFCDTLSTGY